MTLILKSPQYDEDIEQIWSYIYLASPNGADVVVEGIEETIALLADFPKMGTPCPHLALNLRRCSWREFLIYYRYLEDNVEIVRVLHGRRNVEPEKFE